MGMAEIYINCGRYDDAIEELEFVLALEEHTTVNRLKFWPWLDPIRDHPRYQALMKKYALPDGS